MMALSLEAYASVPIVPKSTYPDTDRIAYSEGVSVRAPRTEMISH